MLVFLFTTFLLSCRDENPVAATDNVVAYPWKVDSAQFDFAKYVDPVIGTDGHGHTFPGATAPFGMVQLSPDTRVDGSWDGCSGYHYSDTFIYGFSHTHLSGTGCSDYGDILLMPGTGDVQYNNGADGKPGYRSSFSHTNEKAEAGYYSVVLDNSKTEVELTASPRVGVHRYRFPQKKDAWILVDLKHRDEVIDSEVFLLDDHSIAGYRYSKAWATDQRVWFYLEFSESFNGIHFEDHVENLYAEEARGKNVQASFQFDASGGKPVLVKVALSPVSWENAKLNMQTEVPGWDFDEVRKKVVQQWNSELGRIEVKSGDETKKKIFYTALYHCFIAPNLYCDVNGDYRGRDGKVHRDTVHPQYTVFSLWDTYRALHPLFTIIQQKRTNDFINTFVKQAQEGGRLPVWELSANETDCMIGYHSVPVIVDAWMKGLKDWDTATAYEAMKAGAMADERGLEEYKRCGYIPAEGEPESVSKTLEYAYDDWCIAIAAKMMKNEEDYELFNKRSQSWKNVYDPETGFFRARLNNSFVEPFTPGEVNFHFTEANAWQYSLAVPHHMQVLKRIKGSPRFEKHLDGLFSASPETSGREQADITGLIGQYAQGNEPSHHMAYVYGDDDPWKTQQIVSQICNTLYTDQPGGLCGNEDCGQMSAWYVFSSIGFYPVNPCGGTFQTGFPQFEEVVFHLENGKKFVVVPAEEANETYTDGSVARPVLNYSDIMKGDTGKIIIYKNLGGAKRLCWVWTINDIVGKPVLAVPYVANASSRAFNEKAELQLATIDPRSVSRIRYQLGDGEWKDYSAPIVITENSTLRTCAVPYSGTSNEYLRSDTATAGFFKAPPWKSVTLGTKYASQYAAGGNNALIDGIRGPLNFRTGSWQGYEGVDIEAVVNLGGTKSISRIDAGFLQDQDAWIFMPEQVTFYTSTDGKTFTELETVKNTIADDRDGAVLHDFYTRKPVKASYIKIVAKNRSVCPAWHPGKGKPCWLFADEIVVATN